MRARTELLLYKLDWLSGKVLNPNWHSLESSFESWAYGNGLLRQIQRLEAQAYIELRKDEKTGDRLVRLTGKGVRHCRSGIDPEAKWSRVWDGKWRMILFDVPESDRQLRSKLRRRLVNEGFGWLQQSVWIAPSPCLEMIAELRGMMIKVGFLTLMEGEPVGGESAADLVLGAWDFQGINEMWCRVQLHMDGVPDRISGKDLELLAKWMEQDRKLIRQCLQMDPLLPSALLPDDYLGKKVWKKRAVLMSKLENRFS